MKRFGYLCICLLFLFTAIVADSRPVAAAEEEYTYTVRLYAGNLGSLKKGGVEVSSQSAKVKSERDCIVVSGLKYGDTVYIAPQKAASVTDERYYVKGVRRSGRDNSEAEAPTFHVASDRDYVVAYGIRGDMAEYTVNYQDSTGKALIPSDTYYGNIGERQYVSARYIDGYQPDTLNMVKTISANKAENVFTFRYTAVTTPTTPAPTPAPTTPSATTPATTGGGTTGTTAAAGTAAGGTADAGQAADAETPAEGGQEAVPDEDVPLGGDAQLPDGEVPLGQQELEDLDDNEEVPLSEIKAEQAGLMGYFPIYLGIGIAAAAVLAVTGIYLIYRRRKKSAVKSDKNPDGKTTEQKK